MRAPLIGSEDWEAANPKKFAVYNSQYDGAGGRYPTTFRRPWVASGGTYYRECATFQEALNYALDKAALL